MLYFVLGFAIGVLVGECLSTILKWLSFRRPPD